MSRYNDNSLVTNSTGSPVQWLQYRILDIDFADDIYKQKYFCLSIQIYQFFLCRNSPVCSTTFLANNKEYTKAPGGRLNKKDGLTRYGNSHVKDKTS